VTASPARAEHYEAMAREARLTAAFETYFETLGHDRENKAHAELMLASRGAQIRSLRRYAGRKP
jgi:hypothetical protein